MMSFKTILVYVDDTPNLEQRLGLAFNLAARESAHVIGAALSGISSLVFQGGDGTDLGMAECLNTMLDIARKQAMQSLDRLQAFAQSRPVSFERRLVEDEPNAGMISLAFHSDLVVLGQTNRDDPASNPIAYLPEYVAIGSGRPVLVVPYSGNCATLGKRILIGWNASTSSVHAVAYALPFLKQAAGIDVAVFNRAAEHESQRSLFHSDLAHYFVRHGLEVDISIADTKKDIGIALLDMAQEKRSDLLVMGCYGHARFREILLGGATRTVLEKTRIPVLMAH